MALPDYSNLYDVFGGKDATNDLIAAFRSMGLDDTAINSVFAPYIPATTPTAYSGALGQTTADSTTKPSTASVVATLSFVSALP